MIERKWFKRDLWKVGNLDCYTGVCCLYSKIFYIKKHFCVSSSRWYTKLEKHMFSIYTPPPHPRREKEYLDHCYLHYIEGTSKLALESMNLGKAPWDFRGPKYSSFLVFNGCLRVSVTHVRFQPTLVPRLRRKLPWSLYFWMLDANEQRGSLSIFIVWVNLHAQSLFEFCNSFAP